MRFRVKTIHYASDGMWGAVLFEACVSNGKDAWRQVAIECAADREQALEALKAHYVADHEERMRAIEAAQ